MPDPTLKAVYQLAEEIGRPPEMPPWLGNPDICLAVVGGVETNVMQKLVASDYPPFEKLKARLNQLFIDRSNDETSVPGVASAVDRKRVAMRLWLGCLGTAKMLKAETNDGPTDETTRRESFQGEHGLDALAARCEIYRAGVLFRGDLNLKREPHKRLCFEGVPARSVARTRHGPRMSQG